jgi:hypothetical protein
MKKSPVLPTAGAQQGSRHLPPTPARRQALLLFAFLLTLLTACKDEVEIPAPVPGTVTANAGPDQIVVLGLPVTLDASASTDSQDKTLSFNWVNNQKPAGSNATLTNATQAQPTFVPDLAGEYELEVTVTSPNGQKKDRVIITVLAPQTGPLPAVLDAPITTDLTLTNRIADPTVADYLVTRDILVSARLTVEPGVVIEFDMDKGLEIKQQGALIAKGNAGSKIVFTGKTKVAGFWKGILFGSANELNEMDHVEVAYGGSSTLSELPSGLKANVAIAGELFFAANAKITNTTFRNANGYGLYVGGHLERFSHNTFRDNSSLPLFVPAQEVHNLDPASSYAGAGSTKGIGIAGTVPAHLTGVTWPAFQDGSKYMAIGNLTIEGGVQVAPGVVMEFGPGAGLYVMPGGYLSAKGTAASKITFTGWYKTKGSWKGLVFRSIHSQNELDHVTVSYGGKSEATPASPEQPANVLVYGDPNTGGMEAGLKVTNSAFTHSARYGLVVQSGGGYLTGFAQNRFSQNAGAALYVDANEVYKLDAASRLNDSNGYNGVETAGVVVHSAESHWPVFTDNARYYISGDLFITTGVRIQNSKASHALFEVGADKGIYVQGNGYLIAKGNSDNALVLFSGKTQTPGSWKGILITTNSPLNQLEYAGISFAGSNKLTGFPEKTSLAVQGSLTLRNSGIRYSGGFGLFLQRNAAINDDAGTVNTFQNNAWGNYHREL